MRHLSSAPADGCSGIPSVPCTRSHVLGPLVHRLGRAGTPCGYRQGAHGTVTRTSTSLLDLSAVCAYRHSPTPAFQLGVVPATCQHCSRCLPTPLPASVLPPPPSTARGHEKIEQQWQELPPPVVWDPLLPWRPDISPVRWHRRRICHHQQRRQAWAGWPHRGMRIGEAQNPGLSLAHLLGGKGLLRDSRKLNGCFARFQHVLALTQLEHSRNDEVPHRCTPCRLLARGCAHCLVLPRGCAHCLVLPFP